MGSLISILTSSSLKWIIIFMLTVGIGISIYMANNRAASLASQIAQQQAIITRYEEIVKEKEAYLKQMEDINKTKSDLVNSLINQRDTAETKYRNIVIEIEKKVATGKDRGSSQILKDTFKSLGE